MLSIKTHVGKKKGQNNTDTVWSQVIYAITQTQEVSEENTACSVVDGYVSTVSPIVLAQKHVNISVEKITPKVKCCYLVGGENLRTTSTKPKFKFSTLALLSRKQRSVKRELELCVGFVWTTTFCKNNSFTISRCHISFQYL